MKGLVAVPALMAVACVAVLLAAYGPDRSTHNRNFVATRTVSNVSAAMSARRPSETSACPFEIRSGQMLQQDWGRLGIPHAHVLTVDNHAGKDAIVKLRSAAFGRSVVTFFVANNSTAVYDRVPDGVYFIQYALGDRLSANCATFTRLSHVGQFRHRYLFDTSYDAYEQRPNPRLLKISVPVDGAADGDSIEKSLFDFD